MKNADSSSGGSSKVAPKDIVVRTFDFAVRVIQAADEIKRVIGAIIVSTKRGGTA